MLFSLPFQVICQQFSFLDFNFLRQNSGIKLYTKNYLKLKFHTKIFLIQMFQEFPKNNSTIANSDYCDDNEGEEEKQYPIKKFSTSYNLGIAFEDLIKVVINVMKETGIINKKVSDKENPEEILRKKRKMVNFLY